MNSVKSSLSSDLMPQGVREYDPGYVTFNGQKIPDAEFGNRMPEFTIDDISVVS